MEQTRDTRNQHGVLRYDVDPRLLLNPTEMAKLDADDWFKLHQGHGKHYSLRIPGGGKIEGYGYSAENSTVGAILLPGSGGSTTGPADMYDELSCRLQDAGVNAFRLRFSSNPLRDVLGMIEVFENLGINKVVLIGWSMGGGLAMELAEHPSVVGVAGLAPAGGTRTARKLDDKELLLITGTEDYLGGTSLDIFREGQSPRMLVALKGDTHDFHKSNLEAIDLISEWAPRVLGKSKADIKSAASNTEDLYAAADKSKTMLFTTGRGHDWTEIIGSSRRNREQRGG